MERDGGDVEQEAGREGKVGAAAKARQSACSSTGVHEGNMLGHNTAKH